MNYYARGGGLLGDMDMSGQLFWVRLHGTRTP